MNSQKYKHFNQFQNQIDQNYRENVAKPEMEKANKITQMIRKQEEEAKRKQALEALQRENAQKNWRMNNRAIIEKQIIDKKSGQMVGKTEFEVDMNHRLNHEKNVNDIEFYEKF